MTWNVRDNQYVHDADLIKIAANALFPKPQLPPDNSDVYVNIKECQSFC